MLYNMFFWKKFKEMNRIINFYWIKILYVYIMKDIKLIKECFEEKKLLGVYIYVYKVWNFNKDWLVCLCVVVL